ncbi:SubName: Full=Uncharacterized protein {ECO:0000313/EMBL:CCA77852.1} [Serendipita indica DSM 11827]|nr:SubName: Full=Uncharacterized protein {ECO:0000313/EMBL:CCA77852.1} [Serendipita indica DSM 11827]
MENNNQISEGNPIEATSTPTSESPFYTADLLSKEAWRAALKTGDSTSFECTSFVTYESASTQPPGVFAGTSQPNSPGTHFATLRPAHSRTSTPLYGTWSPLLDRDEVHKQNGISEQPGLVAWTSEEDGQHCHADALTLESQKRDGPAKQEPSGRNSEQRNSGILQNIWSASSAWIGSLNTEIATRRRSVQDIAVGLPTSAPATPSPTKSQFVQSDSDAPPSKLFQNLWKRSSAWIGTRNIDVDAHRNGAHQELLTTQEPTINLGESPIRGGYKFSVLIDDPRAIAAELQQILINQLMELTEAYCRYNPDGYDMHLINYPSKSVICKAANVLDVFRASLQTSSEKLHERLHDVLKLYLDALAAAQNMATPSQFISWRPLIILVLIRNFPTRDLLTVVENAYRELGPALSSQIRITFIQIGDEEPVSRGIRQFGDAFNQSNFQEFISIVLPSEKSRLPEALIRCFIRMAEPYPAPSYHLPISPSPHAHARSNASAAVPAILAIKAEEQDQVDQVKDDEGASKIKESHVAAEGPNHDSVSSSPHRLSHQRTPSKSIRLGLMLLVAQAWVIHDPSRTGYLDKSRIVPFFATLPDELNASPYPAELRIPSLLARSRSSTEPSNHGIDLVKLADYFNSLDFEQIRRRRKKYNYLFWDATLLAQADPKGIPFNHMSVLLSHYGTTDDVEPLDLAKVLGIASSSFTVEDCVRMDRIWSLMRMQRCRKQFLRQKEQGKPDRPVS